MKRWSTGLVVVLLTAVLAACGGQEGGSSRGEITLQVFAAASLTETFEQIGRDFESEHDGVEVVFDFAGSSDLVARIQQGAPADVFASADEANMDKLTAENLHGGEPQAFAANTLQIAVPPDNPGKVRTLQDLTTPGLNLVVCAPEVPCGAASVSVAEAAGVTLSPVSEEQSVTDVLAKVTTGEADAGLVYVTDVFSAGDAVRGIQFPESSAALNVYPIAPVAGSEQAALAQEFIDLVRGAAGQSILRDAGFASAP